MNGLKEYFDKTEGTGVLATADFGGRVDAAIYERPNFMDDETLAFIMTDHLSHKDVATNPHAAYLFMESTTHGRGKRLYLTKVREERDSEAIRRLLEQKHYVVPGQENKSLFLVYFHVDSVRALVEAGEQPEPQRA